MSTTFIILCVFGFVGMLCVIIYYAHKVDTLTFDNGILKRRNATLEERFAQEEKTTEEYQPVLPVQRPTGVEIIQTFAQSHQVSLEQIEDCSDEDFEAYGFSFQGGQFQCFAGKQADEVLLRYYYFYEMPHSNEALFRVLRLCDDFTKNRKYAKLTYSTYKNDEGNEMIAMHLCYEMIGIHNEGLEHLLTLNFMLAREATEALDAIRQEVEGGLTPNDQPTDGVNVKAMRSTLEWMMSSADHSDENQNQ